MRLNHHFSYTKTKHYKKLPECASPPIVSCLPPMAATRRTLTWTIMAVDPLSFPLQTVTVCSTDERGKFFCHLLYLIAGYFQKQRILSRTFFVYEQIVFCYLAVLIFLTLLVDFQRPNWESTQGPEDGDMQLFYPFHL